MMMEWNFLFYFNSVLLGVGLAMDAFSVSLANGLHENRMKIGRMSLIAGVYAVFQFLMPMTGWICVHSFIQMFQSFEPFIPWIAFFLLLYIGGKMVVEAVKGDVEDEEKESLSFSVLLLQGLATSIDALSVGFTITDYGVVMALVCSLIIAVVTFIICICGLQIGKKFGTRFAGKADMLGGLILIFIGAEILIKGLFF